MPHFTWQKSSFSEDQANCVYLASAPDGTLRLRESDAPDTVLLTYGAPLSALLGHLKAPTITPKG